MHSTGVLCLHRHRGKAFIHRKTSFKKYVCLTYSCGLRVANNSLFKQIFHKKKKKRIFTRQQVSRLPILHSKISKHRIFSFLLLFIFMCTAVLSICMSVCYRLSVYLELQTAVSWEPNLVPLEKQSVLLKTESSHQSRIFLCS